MKTVLILRHAKSSWSEPGQADYDRPLNDRGKHDARRVGEVMRESVPRPDVVLSSSAKRARKTTKKAVAASGWDVEVRLLDELYLAPPAAYLAQMQQLPDQVSCVLLVGHNPGLEELLNELTGRNDSLATATLACIELPIERWGEIAADHSGRLRYLWHPKDEA